jgi:hypothetical protein
MYSIQNRNRGQRLKNILSWDDKNRAPQLRKTSPQTRKTSPQTRKTSPEKQYNRAPQTRKTSPQTRKTSHEKLNNRAPQTRKTSPQTRKMSPNRSSEIRKMLNNRLAAHAPPPQYQRIFKSFSPIAFSRYIQLLSL